MSKLTNKFDLPSSIFSAIENISKQYTRGESDLSVSQLIDSPRIRLLKQHHAKDIEEDVSELIYSILGTSVHNLIENSDKKSITEKRLYADCEGWRLSGQLDRLLISDETIEDYKVTSAWSYVFPKESWELQQNVYAWLCRQNKIKISKIQIIGIFRDWQKSKANDSDNYPKLPIQVMPLRLWSNKEQDEYVKDRIRLHQEAQYRFDNENFTPLCSDEDRWKDKEKFAVMIKGKKRAIKLHDEVEDAQDHAKNLSLTTKGVSVEVRPSIARRCKDYCSVKQFCDQAKKEGYV